MINYFGCTLILPSTRLIRAAVK